MALATSLTANARSGAACRARAARGGRRRFPRDETGGRHCPRDASRRRLRAQVEGDFAIEAALSVQADGRTGRVQWTREDDIRHCFYHTTSVERIEIGLDARTSRSRGGTAARAFVPVDLRARRGRPDPVEIGMGLEDVPFDIPNIVPSNARRFRITRIGWFRSVSHIPRAFAQQSIVAELAVELGRDQKDFLLEMIGAPRKLDWQKAGMAQDLWNHGEPIGGVPVDTGRLSNVMELAAAKAGWGKTLPEGEASVSPGTGASSSYIAAVVHAKVAPTGPVRVPEAHLAVDCGFVANPERVLSQMQGACVFGMTAAMYSGIT